VDLPDVSSLVDVVSVVMAYLSLSRIAVAVGTTPPTGSAGGDVWSWPPRCGPMASPYAQRGNPCQVGRS
jgi:hypothetical protein